MAKYQKSKPYNPYIQIGAMKSYYPQFQAFHRKQEEIEFIGDLQVLPELPAYTVSITYDGDKRPKVKVLNPELVEDPPHCFPGSKNLCL